MNERNDILEQLSAYLDDELSDEQARGIEQALVDDPDLVETLNELKATRRLLQSLPRKTLDDDFAHRVVSEVNRRGLTAQPNAVSPSRRQIGWSRYLAAAAVVLVAVGVGTIISMRILPDPSKTVVHTEPSLPPSPPVEIARDTRPLTERETEIAAEPAMPRPDAEPAAEVSEPVIAKGGPTDGPAEERLAMKSGPIRRKAAPSRPVRLGDTGRMPPASASADAGATQKIELARQVRPLRREVIYTENLDLGRRQVEQVLFANGIELAEPRQETLLANQAVPLDRVAEPPASRDDDIDAVEYLVLGNRGQLRRIQSQLDRDVRARQNVSQATEPAIDLSDTKVAPLAEAPAPAAFQRQARAESDDLAAEHVSATDEAKSDDLTDQPEDLESMIITLRHRRAPTTQTSP